MPIDFDHFRQLLMYAYRNEQQDNSQSSLLALCECQTGRAIKSTKEENKRILLILESVKDFQKSASEFSGNVEALHKRGEFVPRR